MENTLNLQKCGLILEGGGLKGNYTAGVLEVLMENELYFPYVISVSSGAFAGASYVARQPGRNIKLHQQFHGDPRYVSLRNLITTRSVFGKDFLFNQVPNKLIPLDYKTMIESSVRFVMVCTNISTGKAEYFEKKKDMLPEEFNKIMEATSSMPYSSNVVKYNGNKYLDGVITDPIPLKKAESEGYKQNVVVLTNPAGYRKKQDFHPPNILLYPWRKNLRKALKNRVKNYNEQLDYLESEEKAKRVVIIRPSIDLNVSRVEKNKEKLLRLYEMGITDAREILKKIYLKKN